MPIGEEMTLEGRLLLTNFGVGIELDDETIWYLDFKVRVHQFVGKRVMVRGVQNAFDRLAASYIESV